MNVTSLARALFVALLAIGARSYVLDDADSCDIYSNVMEMNCGIHENQQDCVGSSCEWDNSDSTCNHPSAEMDPYRQDSYEAYLALYSLESAACTSGCSDARCTSGRDVSGGDACVLTLDATVSELTSAGAPHAIFTQWYLNAYSNTECAKSSRSTCEAVNGCRWSDDDDDCYVSYEFTVGSYAKNCNPDGDFHPMADAYRVDFDRAIAVASDVSYTYDDAESCEIEAAYYICGIHETEEACADSQDCVWEHGSWCSPGPATVNLYNENAVKALGFLDFWYFFCSAHVQSDCTDECAWTGSACRATVAKHEEALVAAETPQGLLAYLIIVHFNETVCTPRSTNSQCTVEGCEWDGSGCTTSKKATHETTAHLCGSSYDHAAVADAVGLVEFDDAHPSSLASGDHLDDGSYTMSHAESCMIESNWLICPRLETQSACAANANCAWDDSEQSCGITDAQSFMYLEDFARAQSSLSGLNAGCAGRTESTCTGDCVWGNDAMISGDDDSCFPTVAAVNAALVADDAPRGVVGWLRIQSFSHAECGSKSFASACEAVEHCEWDSADYEDLCFASIKKIIDVFDDVCGAAFDAAAVKNAAGLTDAVSPPPGGLLPPPPVNNGTAGEPPPRMFADDESAAPAGSERFAVAAALAAATLALTA